MNERLELLLEDVKGNPEESLRLLSDLNEASTKIVRDLFIGGSGPTLNDLLLEVDLYKAEKALQVVEQMKDQEPAFELHAVAPLTVHTVADGFAEIEKRDCFCTHLVWSAKDYSDILKFGRDVIQTETRVDLLRKGYMGTLWGAHTFVSRDQSPGNVTLIGEPVSKGPRIIVRINVSR